MVGGVVRTRRLLFVLHWLVVGGEETEVRLLAQHLRPQWQVDVVVCHHREGMPDQTHRQLSDLGISVDTTPYDLTYAETVAYLARLLPAYDVVVACQAVPHVHDALRNVRERPALIEHGGLVKEALSGPKDLTDCYIGVCTAIRDAAAGRMARPEHALEIPSMVDLREFDPGQRAGVRHEWGLRERVAVVGWVGRLSRKKRVEDVLRAAAALAPRQPEVRWVIIGGPSFVDPGYASRLAALAASLDLGERVRFFGDRPDVPRLLTGLDVLVWLSEGEGMPHVVAEAGAACLPVVATADNGSTQQIVHGHSGLFVPKRDPRAVADPVECLVADPALRRRLGAGMRRAVEERYSTDVVVPRWRALLDELSGP